MSSHDDTVESGRFRSWLPSALQGRANDLAAATLPSRREEVPLSFFDFDQFALGGSIPLISSAPFYEVTANDAPINIETGRIAWWHAGVFCARLVNDSNHQWEDIACVDTDGNAR